MSSQHDHKVYEEMSKRNIEAFVQAMKEARANLAKDASTDEVNRKAHEVLRANERMLEGPLELNSCGGSFSYAAAAIWGTLTTTPTLDFAGWGSLKFEGTHWGLGAGGGISYTVGFSTVPPAQLVGDIEYTLVFTGGPPGAIGITFRRNGALLCWVSGAALNVGTPGAFGGSGKFTR